MGSHNFVHFVHYLRRGEHGEVGSPNVRVSCVDGKSERLIGDRAYDSAPLVAELWEEVGHIAPHRRNRKKRQTQDGRKLSLYKRCWKMERPLAWLHNFRRLVIREGRRAENYLGFV